MTTPLRLPTQSEIDEMREQRRKRRARRVPELAEKALVRLAATPGREWSHNELMKSFCDSNTRTEYGADVWAIVVETPQVVLGPDVVVGGKKIRKVRWDPDATEA